MTRVGSQRPKKKFSLINGSDFQNDSGHESVTFPASACLKTRLQLESV